MKKKLLVLGIAWCCCATAYTQERPDPVYPGSDAPEWMQMMDKIDANVFEIQSAYNAYYRETPFEKNRYTQFYKRWMHWARPYTQADGRLHFPDEAEENLLEHQRLAARKPKPDAAENSAPWTFVGPKSTWDVDANPMVTWQTNIYSFDIAPSNPGVLYAGGESGGMWKTIDKGLNWTLLTAGITHGAFNAVKIHPQDPNTVFAGTSGKLIRTTDGGANWTTVYSESGLSVREMAIHPNHPDTLLAATNKGLLRSINGGANWTKLFTHDTWTVKNKPGAADIYFIVRDNGSGSDFMRSTDAGATWTIYNNGWWTPGSGETVGGAIIAVCPSQPEKIYAYLCGNGSNLYGYVGVFVSTNAGNSWTNTNPANAVGNSPAAYSIPGHTNLMAHNGTTGFDQGFYDMAIVVNPANANQIIAGGTSWFKSTDGGVSWQALGSYVGGLPWSHPDIQWLAVSGSDLWIASDGGLNYSTDFALTHEARMNGISGADLWGFGSGWNEDILVGGRYHNGNMGWHESFPEGQFYRLGGAESATGYVSPGPERKVYHSDIDGDVLKPGFGNGTTGFSVGLWPNESYAYYANSEMVWHPMCWNHVFIGNENKLWKSTDGGTSYSALYTFPGTVDNTVYEIEIARSNPQVVYVSQWDGTDDKIWRSTDGGSSFTAVTALPLPNNNDRVKMAVSATDANTLWVAVTYGSNGKKIYKTTNGGQSWTNLTTTALDGIRITDVMAQYGTDDGVYLGTNAGVMYRNNSMGDWQGYSTGLPLSAETNRIRPFYRDGKIRNGTWGFGVWEAPLYEASTAVVVQAMADKLESACARDTFYFDDYSAVLHAGASWSWTFGGNPQTVIGADTRTPKVVFGSSGSKSAVMTLSTPLGVFKDTLYLTVSNGCDMDSLPGNALVLDGSGDYAAINEPLNLNSNTVTLSAWIKRDGAQNDFAGIVFSRGGSTTAGLSITSGNSLRYHWNDSGWSFNSGLIVPDNEWTHVALVITPTNAKIYKNGVAATHNAAQAVEEFDSGMKFGHDNGSRYFKGQIEEVCIYNAALTQEQIREVMHLTRTHTAPDNAGLVAYYQFNETTGRALDRVGTRHANLVSDAGRAASTSPVGPGTRARLTVNAGGSYAFTGTGLSLDFPPSAAYPNGELCVTRINLEPDFLPAGTGVLSPAYWVVRNFGANTNFSTLSGLTFGQIGTIPTGTAPADYSLFKRTSNAEGDSWGTAIDAADVLAYGSGGTVGFTTGNGINSFSQFILRGPSGALPVEMADFTAELLEPASVQLRWATLSEKQTSHFVVERSTDGLHFGAIGQVNAQGFSATEQVYHYLDTRPVSGFNFYRLRIVDLDGSMAFSAIRAVELKTIAPEIVLGPNPVKAGAEIQISANLPEALVFRLYNEKGQAVRIVRFRNNAEVETVGLPAGVYFYRVQGERYMRMGKVVVE